MKKPFKLAAAVVTVMTMVGVAHQSFAQDRSPIKIGVTYDAAKQASFYSLLQKSAIEVARDEINRAGGILGRQLSLEFADDENNPVIAAQRVEQLNGAGVSFIIEIGSSATGLAAQQKSQELGIPNGSPGNTNGRLTSPVAPSFYFRTGLLELTQNQALVRHIQKTVKSPKVAIVQDTTQTGMLGADATTKELRERGIELVAVEQMQAGSANATPQALRIKASGANVVLIVSASLPEAVAYVKAHKQLGNTAILVGNSALGVPDFIKLAGDSAEGIVFTDIVDFQRSDVAEVNGRLVAAKGAGLNQSPQGIFAYDYLKLVAEAIKAAGSSDRAKIRDAMEAIKNRPTLLGPPGTTISFSPQMRDGINKAEQVVMRQIKNGALATFKQN